MRRLLALGAAIVMLAACAGLPRKDGASAQAQRAVPEGFRRVAGTNERNRTLVCTDPSGCLSQEIAMWQVNDPRGPGKFRLVATLTLSYRLSGGDIADVGISTSCPLTDPPAPCPYPLARSTKPLASADDPTTTTFTWALPPSGGPGWFFRFMADLHDRSGDDSVRLVVREVTAVFEMWPA